MRSSLPSVTLGRRGVVSCERLRPVAIAFHFSNCFEALFLARKLNRTLSPLFYSANFIFIGPMLCHGVVSGIGAALCFRRRHRQAAECHTENRAVSSSTGSAFAVAVDTAKRVCGTYVEPTFHWRECRAYTHLLGGQKWRHC